MDDFIVNNEKKNHSSYGMKSFNPLDGCFLHFIINNEIIHSFWDSVGVFRITAFEFAAFALSSIQYSATVPLSATANFICTLIYIKNIFFCLTCMLRGGKTS
jgi:hypothetical protein